MLLFIRQSYKIPIKYINPLGIPKNNMPDPQGNSILGGHPDLGAFLEHWQKKGTDDHIVVPGARLRLRDEVIKREDAPVDLWKSGLSALCVAMDHRPKMAGISESEAIYVRGRGGNLVGVIQRENGYDGPYSFKRYEIVPEIVP